MDLKEQDGTSLNQDGNTGPCQAKQTNSFLKMDPGTRSSLVSFQVTLEAWKRVIAVNRVGYAGHARA